jgi:dihydroorotase
LPLPSLAVGAPANLTLLDAEARTTIDPPSFHSKGRNTPFAGKQARGRVLATLVEGRFVHDEIHNARESARG